MDGAERSDSGAKPAALLDQLHGARDRFRLERQRIESDFVRRRKQLKKGEAQLLEGERALALEKKRLRAIYQRCLLRIKSRWAAERNSAAQERAALEEAESRFHEQSERKRTELERQAGRVADDKVRLQSAWELLTEGQRRAIADRRESDVWLARQRDALDLRAKRLHEQQELCETNRRSLEGRQPQLVAEIAGLEARATHLRQSIAQLEEKRNRQQTEGGRGDAPALAAVSLDAPLGSLVASHRVDNLLTELQDRDQELARERQSLAQTRQQLKLESAELADQRAVLAEQVAALSLARNLWQTAEAQTVEELHTLALGVRSEEQSLEERERELLVAERRRRGEDHALVELRFKLENWQVALAAKESGVQSDADRLEVRLAAKQAQMDRWEASLEGTASTWADLRQREIAFLNVELDRLSVIQAEQAAAATETRQTHEELGRRLTAIAARELAQTGDSRGTTRRVRVLERRWTTHFRREAQRLLQLEGRLQQQRHALDERDRRLQRETHVFLERQLAEGVARTVEDRERMQAERRLWEARDEADLEMQLRFRTEQEAHRLRAGIARMAESILTANLTNPEEPEAVLLSLIEARAA